MIFYFGNTGLIDIYNPEGASWFWSIYKELKNKGIAGVWGDLGEPEVHPKICNIIQHLLMKFIIYMDTTGQD